MNIRKMTFGVTLLSLMGVLAGAASAQETIATITSTSGRPALTFTGGMGGTLYVPSVANSATGVATSTTPYIGVGPQGNFKFGPITETSTVTTAADGTLSASFTGGNFSIVSTQNSSFGAAGTTLLDGTFDGTLVSGKNSSGSIVDNFTGIDVVYDTATPYAQYYLATHPGIGLIGTLSLSFTGAQPKLAISNDGGFKNFTASGLSGSFDASSIQATPEPGTYAAFAFTGFGVMGLMLRARKSRGSMSA